MSISKRVLEGDMVAITCHTCKGIWYVGRHVDNTPEGFRKVREAPPLYQCKKCSDNDGRRHT